ncbi:MAG: hypothetical protein ACOC6C_06380 [Verrucomicrobiota bacterium]
MHKKDSFDFWYAVNNTEVLLMPRNNLETFGATVLNYHLVSELMDKANTTRVREGRIQASKPTIITPEAYSDTVLEGFGDEAREYVEWLKSHEQQLRILEYGYNLKKENYSEHIISENPDTVAENVRKSVEEKRDPLSAVVYGVDDPWDVCLVKLFWEVIKKSVPANVRDMEHKGMFLMQSNPTQRIREELEHDFAAAAKDPDLIKNLAKKLRDHNLFEEYEDRFFALVKGSRNR